MGANESRDLGGRNNNNGEGQGNNRREDNDDFLSKMVKVGAAVAAAAALVTVGTQLLLSDSGTENKKKASERNEYLVGFQSGSYGEPSNHSEGTQFSNLYHSRFIEANSICAPNPKWEKPEPGTIKLNTDAARHDEHGCGRIGGLLRDSSGWVISFYSKKIELNDIDMLELEAIKEGILEAVREKTQALWVESDSESVVNVINGSSKSSGKYSLERKLLVKDINDLLVKFPEKKVTHCKREANRAANHLTKLNCPYKDVDLRPNSIRRDLAIIIKEDVE